MTSGFKICEFKKKIKIRINLSGHFEAMGPLD